ncbi:hypothetical protein BESB_035480 [Besnoitia besnoiti]|uniref:Chromatin assembly factor 1 subunit A n=1 Tax=Besnoitia besnoiti TaxID=94643 RepID=A0A2A9MN63_BESBE|nr:hypothetical protein BESB_035480 [Besnoitia besnoiti]PFH37090.1 hypothetical protein BESB_035480 [Besnoitia besnoiti]
MPARSQGAAPHMLPVAGAPAKSSIQEPVVPQNGVSSIVESTGYETVANATWQTSRRGGENGISVCDSASDDFKRSLRTTSSCPLSCTTHTPSPTRNCLHSGGTPSIYSITNFVSHCTPGQAAAVSFPSSESSMLQPDLAQPPGLASPPGLHTSPIAGISAESTSDGWQHGASDLQTCSAVAPVNADAPAGDPAEGVDVEVDSITPERSESDLRFSQGRTGRSGSRESQEDNSHVPAPSRAGAEESQVATAGVDAIPSAENKAANGPRRSAGRGARAKRAARSSAGAGAPAGPGSAGPKMGAPKTEQERIRKLYDPLWKETEQELQLVLAQGLPEVNTLTNPPVYLDLKQQLLNAPCTPQSCSADDEDEGSKTDSEDASLNPLKRLLRALGEGSSLPLSSLIVQVQRVLRDDSDGSPTEEVTDETLRTLLPVLLARRSLGISRQRGNGPIGGAAAAAIGDSPDSSGLPNPSLSQASSPARRAAGAINMASLGSHVTDKNEDVTPSSLWVWESAFLEGLPSAFKEKTRRDREKRGMISRRVRSLVRLQQVIEQGVEKDILAAKEKAEALKRKEQQEEEKRREQELRRRRAEEARAEREREKRQREDAKKEKEKEKEKKKQSVEDQKQSPPPKAPQKTENKKVLKDTQAVKGQQILMASWLTRKPPRASASPPSSSSPSAAAASGTGALAEAAGTGAACDGPGGGESSAFGRGPSSAAQGQEVGEQSTGESVESDQDASVDARKAAEAARTRATIEADIWRVPEGTKHHFIDIVLRLPQPLSPLPATSCDSIPLFDDDEPSRGADAEDLLAEFVEGFALPHMTTLREFHTFCARNRQFVHKLPVQAQAQAAASGESRGSAEVCAPGVRSFQQEMREIRQGLTLTDYTDNSLRDLPYLRTAWVNLDEWKRPVRRLLLGKQAKKSTPCEQWAEESCIDYDRDSDEEWFENFDVDDLDEGKDEEEEEEPEGEEDKDWLVEDDDEASGAGRSGFGHSVRFESLCDWQWFFEGEEKANARGEGVDPWVVQTVRDRNWASIYGCVVDDWGGKPFEKLEAALAATTQRKKMTEEELCSLFKFCHAKKDSKVKLIADFHKLNKHLTKADLERRFKEQLVYERRPEDKLKRWYVSAEAMEAYSLKEELDAIAAAIRAEESAAQLTSAQQATEAIPATNSADGSRPQATANATSSSQAPESPTSTAESPSGGATTADGAARKGGGSLSPGAVSGSSVSVHILRQAPAEMSANNTKKARTQGAGLSDTLTEASVASQNTNTQESQSSVSPGAATSARGEVSSASSKGRLAGPQSNPGAGDMPTSCVQSDPFRELDPFASATATALVAASSARAAAATAVQPACGGGAASAAHVAAAAMAAAALAREMAASMADAAEMTEALTSSNDKKIVRTLPTAVDEKGQNYVRSPTATSGGSRCVAAADAVGPREGADAVCGDGGETPRHAKKSDSGCDEIEDVSAEDAPVWGKRRRSDGAEEGSGSSSSPGSSVGTTKKTKRASAGLIAGSAPVKGSNLKNTLITQFFRAVPPGAKRSAEDATETPS